MRNKIHQWKHKHYYDHTTAATIHEKFNKVIERLTNTSVK